MFFINVFIVFIILHFLSLFFFDKAQKDENGQDRIFSKSWRDMAPDYILGSLPLRGNACVDFQNMYILYIYIYIYIYIEVDIQIH